MRPAQSLLVLISSFKQMVMIPSALTVAWSTRVFHAWSLYSRGGEEVTDFYGLGAEVLNEPDREALVAYIGRNYYHLPCDWLRVSEALCMRFNPQSRRRVRNNDCCVPEEA